MEKFLILENDRLYLEINPQLGGTIVNFFIKKNNSKISVFRKTSSKDIKKNNILLNSYFPLIPFSGRVSNAVLKFKNKFYNLKKNIDGEKNALHGDGWQNPWIVKKSKKNYVVMKLNTKSKNWPFKYSGFQTIKIIDDVLQISLEITNLDKKPMPCGLGFHPWFEMTPQAILQMKANKFWAVGKDNLFKNILNLNKRIDFSYGKKIMNTDLANGYSEWDGFASIKWPEKNISLKIKSSNNLKHLIIYTPKNGNFFCLEPASHSVDAFNLYAKGIKGTGTKVLQPRNTFKVTTSFHPKII